MRVLVIGGNGFIGASLVEALRAEGREVTVLDRALPRADVDWTGVDYVSGGLDDVPSLVRALAGVDAVVHLASSTVPSTSNLDPVADVEGNLVGTLNLLRAMREAHVRRIVFLSSGGTVYGNPDALPVREDHPLRPICSYGVVKAAIEHYLGMYAQLGAIEPLIVRPSNPYGPRQSSAGLQGAIAAFLGRVRDGQRVQIWGDSVRDYLHVDDLVRFIVRALATQACGTVNVGSGEGTSLSELCGLVGTVTGRPLAVDIAPAREFDVHRIVLDITLARTQFGWSPRIGLANGIDSMWKVMQARATIQQH